jgi:ribosome-binding factor A
MPVNRSAEHHRERLVDAIKEEIIAIIEGELSDPRIGLCFVTEVVLAPGGKSARVLIQADGSEEEAAETIEGLMGARGYVRSEVRNRLGKRHVPELTFHLDRSQQIERRLTEVLKRVKKRAKKGTGS